MDNKPQNILIRNIYYMLSYAFKELQIGVYKEVDKEQFDEVHDLFAEILRLGLTLQIKQGLYRNYKEEYTISPVLRGRILLAPTIKERMARHMVIASEQDLFTEDNLHNRILKSTVYALATHDKVNVKRRKALRKLLLYMRDISTIPLNHIPWSSLAFQKDNQRYRMLLTLCRLAIEGLILTTSDGTHNLPSFSTDKLHELFENFVYNYFTVKHKEMMVHRPQLRFRSFYDSTKNDLGVMQTDVVLTHGTATLIIDTKYYSKIFINYYEKTRLRRPHIYQIFSYLMNYPAEEGNQVDGMLLYAQTVNEKEPFMCYETHGHNIYVRSINLDQPFSLIKGQLDDIAELIIQTHINNLKNKTLEANNNH